MVSSGSQVIFWAWWAESITRAPSFMRSGSFSRLQSMERHEKHEKDLNTLGWNRRSTSLTQNQCHLTAETVIDIQWILFVVLLLVLYIGANDTSWHHFRHFVCLILFGFEKPPNSKFSINSMNWRDCASIRFTSLLMIYCSFGEMSSRDLSSVACSPFRVQVAFRSPPRKCQTRTWRLPKNRCAKIESKFRRKLNLNWKSIFTIASAS